MSTPLLRINHYLQLLNISSNQLWQITPDSLIIAHTLNLTSHLTAVSSDFHNYTPNFDKFLSQVISPALVRVNHLGINYFVKDVDQERQRLSQLLKSTSYHLYQEKSPNPHYYWLFAGNTQNWQDPVFEFAISDQSQKDDELWFPRFQIDLDTTLSGSQIEQQAITFFGPDFIKYRFLFHNNPLIYMGLLENYGGVKIYLDIGTIKRRTDLQRKFWKLIA